MGGRGPEEGLVNRLYFLFIHLVGRLGHRLFKNLKVKGIGMNLAKLWAIQVSKLTKIKGRLRHRSLFNTTVLYSHIQPWPPLCLRIAASKSKPLKSS